MVAGNPLEHVTALNAASVEPASTTIVPLYA